MSRPLPPAWRRFRRPAIVLLVLAVLAGGVVWWLDRGRHLFIPKNWGVVVPGRIWRSGQMHGRLVEKTLREHGIEVVVDLARDDPDNADAEAEREAVRRLGIRKVDLIGLSGDGTGWVQDYVVALRELAIATREDHRVLVHCAGGSERAGGVVACYRMLYQGWTGARAWAEYLSYRSKPPTKDVLPRFLNGNLSEIARRLRASGNLSRVPDPLPVFGPAPSADGSRK